MTTLNLLHLLNRIQLEANTNNLSTVIGLAEEAKELAENIHLRLKGLQTKEQRKKWDILEAIK